jgi:hypothetical protein
VSDHGCDCKRSRDDILAGEDNGVRSQIRLQGSRDNALAGGAKGARWSQITDATAKGAGKTHFLEVKSESDGVRP